MSRIDDLIAEHCPDGVGYKSLDEIGVLYSGLTGKSKADFAAGNARYVTYVNVFNNLSTDVEPGDRVQVADGERQNRVRYGDVLFTASSESADEVGMASGVTVDPPEPLYLNSFCFGFRPNHVDDLDPEFAKHLFRSAEVRRQIIRTANGVTRINISKARFRAIKVPVPPLAIQREIAAILDKMETLKAELESELESELELRSRQYAFYRNDLMAFGSSGSVEWLPMGQVGEFIRGRRFTKKDVGDRGLACINFGEIYTHYGTFAHEVISHVRADLGPGLRFARRGDVVLTGVSETVEDICKAVAWLGEGEVAVHDDCFIYRHNLNPKFVSYYLQTSGFNDQKAKHVARAKVKRISAESLSRLLIPVPPIEEQERIVAVLDKFDALVNDLSYGLPAEINARRAQYEYYRDRLLTFEELAA
jgi:type I restriction enzyme S subunit